MRLYLNINVYIINMQDPSSSLDKPKNVKFSNLSYQNPNYESVLLCLVEDQNINTTEYKILLNKYKDDTDNIHFEYLKTFYPDSNCSIIYTDNNIYFDKKYMESIGFINNYNYINYKNLTQENMIFLLKLFMLSSSHINNAEKIETTKNKIINTKYGPVPEPTPNKKINNNNFDPIPELEPAQQPMSSIDYFKINNSEILSDNFYNLQNEQPSSFNDLWDNTKTEEPQPPRFLPPNDEYINDARNNLRNLSASTYSIYYNTKTNQPVIINMDKFSKTYNTESFLEIKFINSFSLTENQIESINKQYYENAEELNIFINNNILNNPVKKEIKTKPSNESVIADILKLFTLTNNSENHIKFNNIWTEYCSNKIIDPSCENIIKNQLSSVLLSLGLSKKRYSDGVHWYGLIKRNNIEPEKIKSNYFNISTSNKIDDELNKLIKHRDEIDKEIIASLNKTDIKTLLCQNLKN